MTTTRRKQLVCPMCRDRCCVISLVVAFVCMCVVRWRWLRQRGGRCGCAARRVRMRGGVRCCGSCAERRARMPSERETWRRRERESTHTHTHTQCTRDMRCWARSAAAPLLSSPLLSSRSRRNRRKGGPAASRCECRRRTRKRGGAPTRTDAQGDCVAAERPVQRRVAHGGQKRTNRHQSDDADSKRMASA